MFLEKAVYLCCERLHETGDQRGKCEHEGALCRYFQKYLTDGACTL